MLRPSQIQYRNGSYSHVVGLIDLTFICKQDKIRLHLKENDQPIPIVFIPSLGVYHIYSRETNTERPKQLSRDVRSYVPNCQ